MSCSPWFMKGSRVMAATDNKGYHDEGRKCTNRRIQQKQTRTQQRRYHQVYSSYDSTETDARAPQHTANKFTLFLRGIPQILGRHYFSQNAFAGREQVGECGTATAQRSSLLIAACAEENKQSVSKKGGAIKRAAARDNFGFRLHTPAKPLFLNGCAESCNSSTAPSGSFRESPHPAGLINRFTVVPTAEAAETAAAEAIEKAIAEASVAEAVAKVAAATTSPEAEVYTPAARWYNEKSSDVAPSGRKQEIERLEQRMHTVNSSSAREGKNTSADVSGGVVAVETHASSLLRMPSPQQAIGLSSSSGRRRRSGVQQRGNASDPLAPGKTGKASSAAASPPSTAAATGTLRAAVGGCTGRHGSRLGGGSRTARTFSQRLASTLLNTRHSFSEDVLPPVKSMSDADWLIVKRLTRKINSSNFASVLKAYLILKTRVAAQRANKEYLAQQRKRHPAGVGLQLLLNRRSSRVAVRTRPAAVGVKRRENKGAKATRLSTSSSNSSVTKNLESSKKSSHEEANSNTASAAAAGSGSLCAPAVAPVSIFTESAVCHQSGGNTNVTPTEDEELGGPVKSVGSVGRVQKHQSLLDQRLAFLGLKSMCIRGDGNCLFRSCAWNFFGNQDLHKGVRQRATAHMRAAESRSEYEIFFENASEFEHYLKNMAKCGTWGDELCVRAIADAFCCTIHILTSTVSNWYLRYDPQLPSNCARLPPPQPIRHIFLTYISPIHYNAFTVAREDAIAEDVSP